MEMANPLVKDHEMKMPIQHTKDQDVEKILKFAVLIYKIHNAFKTIASFEKIKNGITYYLRKF